MNERQDNLSYAAIIAEQRSHRACDVVQQTLDELEESGRDLRNVTLDEFKTLLMRTIRKQSARSSHLVSC